MKNVFLTGATGVMGMAGLKELTRFPDEYKVTVLARKSSKNEKKLTPFIRKGVKVIWGDLLDRSSIQEGIKNADIVLHVGGMVSPEADKYPEKTLKVNIGSMRLICEEVKKIESENPDKTIAVVYIGSVSQYGSHLPPDHWGEVGMTLTPAHGDAYAYSKIMSERELITSGIKKWVSLRQTAILHPGLLMKANNPSVFHVPLQGVLEWVTVEDSGRLLERVCRDNIPDDFWGNFYNIGGGKSYRMTNLEFEKKLLKALNCPPPEKIFEPSWFATRNFHGIWFKDSDHLDRILHFRNGESSDEWFEKVKKDLPFYFSLAGIVPAKLIKGFMKKVALTPEFGTLWAVRNGKKDLIDILWGSSEKYSEIKGWDKYKEADMPREIPTECSNHYNKENNAIKTERKICKNGHAYLTSRFIEERGGHNCPECLREKCGIK